MVEDIKSLGDLEAVAASSEAVVETATIEKQNAMTLAVLMQRVSEKMQLPEFGLNLVLVRLW